MKKFIKIIMFFIIISLIFYYGYNMLNDEEKEKIIEELVVKKLTIFDEDKNDRNIAVMINNNHNAWPHSGLDKSYINYEIIVEGGITRIMSIYKGAENMPEKIGSVRSARPYFLDYALENDAIYVHWGGSEEAYSNITLLNIDDIDGMDYEGRYFYRDRSSNRSYEHTGFTKGSMINNAISDLNIRNTSDSVLFKYSVDEIDFSNNENSIKADEITIDYSYYQDTSYVYDSENKVYKRYMNDEAHTDEETNKQYTAKNIIVYFLRNETIDSYNRQKLYNIVKAEGYYITNGYASKIYAEKNSRKGKTKYTYKDSGKEIVLNDGNTWIQIVPIDRDVDIKEISNNNEFTE